MAVEFQCEHCGELISADGDAGMEVACPFCEGVTAIPEGLASLPTPQIPGQEGAPEVQDLSSDEDLQDVEGDEVDGDGEDLDDEELDEEDAELTPFAEFMAKSMPWMVTVAIHGAIFLLLTALVVVTFYGTDENADIPIPDTNITDTPGGAVSPVESPVQDPSQSVKPTDARQSEVESDASVDTGEFETEVSSYGTAGGGASGGNPFGTGDGGGGGTPAPFFGNGGNAKYVVFVIDRSGSMHGSFDAVRTELIGSIARLSVQNEQEFDVILFASGRPMQKPPAGLISATDENKKATGEFLADVVPFGQTDPIPALEAAFQSLRSVPQTDVGVIQLLTDGSFPDNAATLDRIAELNRNKSAVIHTFLYGFRPPEAEAVLRAIAKNNGGNFKYISPDEF